MVTLPLKKMSMQCVVTCAQAKEKRHFEAMEAIKIGASVHDIRAIGPAYTK